MLLKYITFQQPEELAGLQAPVIKDILDARLISVWMKLLTSNFMQALYERDKIASILRNKRNISPIAALSSNNLRTKAWPSEWKPYLVVQIRIKGKVSCSSNWPWSKEEILINKIQGNELSVKKILEILKKTISPPISLHTPSQAT